MIFQLDEVKVMKVENDIPVLTSALTAVSLAWKEFLNISHSVFMSRLTTQECGVILRAKLKCFVKLDIMLTSNFLKVRPILCYLLHSIALQGKIKGSSQNGPL